MTLLWHVTYELITDASAEQGDAAERGYYGYGGWHHDIETLMAMPDAAREVELDCMGMDLRTALRCIGCVEDSGRWFSETDGDINYATGEHEFRHLHPPKGITGASYQRVKRLLRSLNQLSGK